jgi:hypothetical protein
MGTGWSERSFVHRAVIAECVSDRPAQLRSATERIRTEDAELLDRLSR